ncbi:phage holin [Pantoea ananatis]|uniref:phage holin n=1 Tax=Pantoea ananas TaxID=553 RepID=UPI00091E9D36|nr:phage holin [Pantoea ananatis]MDF7789601.1 phage holin [Pantoea ananatis]PKC39123.1 lysis S family protein [Pantoea ananatis BRT98]PQK99598.1 lysis protein [Pantoea ananatis]SFX18297.1 Lysis protein S [Pantoea ananatis]
MVKNMPDKISTATNYSVSGGLMYGGLTGWFGWLHGLDWNQIALIGGFIIAMLTFITNIYFKRRQTKAYEKALDRGYVTPPPQDD